MQENYKVWLDWHVLVKQNLLAEAQSKPVIRVSDAPTITICYVHQNNKEMLETAVESLAKLTYPKEKLRVWIHTP